MVERSVALIMVAALAGRAAAQPAPAPAVESPAAQQVDPEPAAQDTPFATVATTTTAAPVATPPLLPPAATPPISRSPTTATPLAAAAPCDTPPTTRLRWYGWQVLASDATMLGFAAITKEPGFAFGWIGSGSLVHFAHRNVGRGIASATLRAGLPFLGFLIGASSSHGCSGDWCGLGETVGGTLIGIVTAELLDVSLLSFDDTPAATPARTAQHSQGIELAPVVRASHSGGGVGLVGRF